MRTNQRNSGFTIVEIMITLAVAGMLMALMFYSIITIKRMSRNRQRTSDVSLIKVHLSEYYNNNKGVGYPWPPGNGGVCWLYVDNSGPCPIAYNFFKDQIMPNMGYYKEFENIFYATDYNAGGFGTRTVAQMLKDGSGTDLKYDGIFINSSSECVGNDHFKGSNLQKNMVITYAIEGANGPVYRCVSVLDL